MNKRQAKKYNLKLEKSATTNSTVEEHKSGSLSNTKRIKHYTTVVRQTFPKPQIKIAKKRVRPQSQWRKRLGAAPEPEIKGLNDYKGRKTYFSGPFDAFGQLKGYKRAAQSAGNRIEHMHPGFFDKYIKLGISNLLDLIFDNYANYHSSSFYDANESYVDEVQYEFLIDVLDEQLDEKEV